LQLEGKAMLKTLGLIVAGLLAGLAIAVVLPGDDSGTGDVGEFLDSLPQDATADERLSGLHSALRSEAQARLALEARVEELGVPAEVAQALYDALVVARKSLATYGEHPIIEDRIKSALSIADGDEQ
jgi:hypothetical protein